MHGDKQRRYQAIDRCLAYCVFTARDTKAVFRKIRGRFPERSRAGVIVGILLLAIVQALATWLLRRAGQAG